QGHLHCRGRLCKRRAIMLISPACTPAERRRDEREWGMATSDYYEVLDPRFGRLFNGNAQVEQLYTGCRWAEGPAYFAAGRYLVWSDIPNDRILRFDETDGSVSVFRSPAGNTNGHTVDRQGRLVSCEHGGRRVSRTEHDGTVVTIADSFEGKRLNSPNDVVEIGRASCRERE